MGLGFNKGKVTYTVTGSPTITAGGVVSAFSSTDYLTFPNWTDEGYDLEFCLTFLLPSSYPLYSRALNQINTGSNASFFTIPAYQNGLNFRINSSESLSLSYSLQRGVKYTGKLARTSGVYTLYLLDASKNVLATSSPLQTNSLLGGGNSSLMRIGYEGSIYGEPFGGEIYLQDQTYLEENGEYWFTGFRDITGVQYNGQAVNKLLFNGVQVWPDIPRYNVGTPSFLMRFDGSFRYYSDGNITAELVNSPSLTTGGPWGLGALAQTYDENDVRRAVQVNINKSYWQTDAQPFFIEWWAKIENTDQTTIWQTFLGNMTHPDTNYNGWAYRWRPGDSSAGLTFANNTSSLTRTYTQLNATQQSAWQTLMNLGNWTHFGFYIRPQHSTLQGDSWFLANGKMFELTGNWAEAMAEGGQNNFLIGNSTYGTAPTLSPMAEVRIITGQNADDYITAIKGNYDSATGMYNYTVPTASFADGGLTQYTAS